MEVYGKFTQKVTIDPKDVINSLIREEINSDWVYKRDDKFYLGFEVGAGNHSWNDEKEISEEKYNYVKALYLILEKLNNKINKYGN